MPQLIMDELVYGIFKPKAVATFRRVIGALKAEGCDAVVLGCTEIPLIIDDTNAPLPTLDSTRLLAPAAAQQPLGFGQAWRSPVTSAPSPDWAECVSAAIAAEFSAGLGVGAAGADAWSLPGGAPFVVASLVRARTTVEGRGAQDGRCETDAGAALPPAAAALAIIGDAETGFATGSGGGA